MFAPHLPIATPARLRLANRDGGVEARVTIVDERRGIGRSRFAWLSPQKHVANTLNARR